MGDDRTVVVQERPKSLKEPLMYHTTGAASPFALKAWLRFELEALPGQEGLSERDKLWQVKDCYLQFESGAKERDIKRIIYTLLDTVK